MAKEPTAGDVMSDGVIAIDEEASVREAAQRMRQEDIRSLVVVDNDEAVGIVVGRDIVYKVVTEGLDADTTPVSAVMTNNLVTAMEEDNIEDIARAMIRNNISRVPVLRGDSLIGMVTQTNMIRAWPSYLDLLAEESQVFVADNPGPGETVEETSGICDSCENYSDELVEVDGDRLCPECLAAER